MSEKLAPALTSASSAAPAALPTHSVCPWKTETQGMGSRKSQSRNVVSLLEVTTTRRWGWALTCVSSRSWPASVLRLSPVVMSKSCAVRSQEAVTTCPPGGLRLSFKDTVITQTQNRQRASQAARLPRNSATAIDSIEKGQSIGKIPCP